MKNNLNEQTITSFEKLVQLVKVLRSENGCDWDKVQTNESLIPYFIEEVYEMIDSIDNKNVNNTKEELGDILLHVVLQSEIFKEHRNFNLNDVIINISDKLIKRHPHVFQRSYKDNNLNDKENWEVQKYKDKNRNSILDGVPNILPSIIMAQRIQEKASMNGFDWQNIDSVWEKFYEEVNELKVAQESGIQEKMQEELGDVLFTIINLSRFMNISSENALRKSNKKFIHRFKSLEKKVKELDKKVNNVSIDTLNQIWEDVKKSS